MWIEETKNGLRLVERADVNGKTQRVSVPIARNTPQGRRQAQEQLLERIAVKQSSLSEKPLTGLVEPYFSMKDVKVQSEKVAREQLMRIIDVVGDVPAYSLTAPYIMRKLVESGKRTQTINRYIKDFRTFLRWAFVMGYIQEDIATKLTPIRTKTQKKKSEDLYLEADELREVLDQLRGMTRYIVQFLALTGCRIGEAAALDVSDVGTKYIHITKNFSSGIMTTPKSEASFRDIYIQPELREFLSQYMEWRKVHMMAKGIRTDFLFFSNRGTRIAAGNLNTQLNRIDFPKHLHPHIFRHTHTALLAEHGVPLEAISRRLGHETSDITREVYMHVTTKMKREEEAMVSRVRIL